MGLGRMWQRVRSLSERPHNLLAISDLHLGCDLRPGNKLDKPRTTDGPLASFLRHHAAHSAELRHWKGPPVVKSTADPLIPAAIVPVPA